MPGEVNVESNEWYERMSKALKRRERAQLYIRKWEDELASAQEDMRQLAVEQNSTPITPEAANSMTVSWGNTTENKAQEV